MFAREKILDDLARVAGGGASVLSGLRRQIGEDIKVRMDDMAARLDLVPREDFERLEIMLAETRALLDEQAARIETLEGARKDNTKSREQKG